MRANASRFALAWVLIAFLFLGLSPLESSDGGAADVQVISVMVKMQANKVQLRLKVINRSHRPVFLAGSNFERPRPGAVFLEQWLGKKGWTAVAPCLDVPPGDVIRLDSGRTVDSGYDLHVIPPRLGVCEAPNLQHGGEFRYRLVYFAREKEARFYAEHAHSSIFQPPGARVALSEPFEIPPAKE